MSTGGSLLLALALFLFVTVLIIRPFLEARQPVDERVEQPLLQRKESLLQAIERLEFDLETGKIEPELHARERAHLVHQAALTLREIDGMATGRSTPTIDDQIEAAILAKRQAPEAAPAGGFCPSCGNGVDATDRFCARCGHALAE